MSTQKANNPSVDMGFHVILPRLVRTGYKHLTPIQKWLYTCLKDLCGNHGTCYRTLRVLSEETGISTGMLSESIPVLHAAGLIHAEKKKRHTGGKEVWHITIVDIWQANAKEHPTKRSQREQTTNDECSQGEQNTNVHDVNVHTVNDTTGECSCCEPECSQIRHRSNNSLSNTITEAITRDTSADASNTAPSDSAIAPSLALSSSQEQASELSTNFTDVTQVLHTGGSNASHRDYPGPASDSVRVGHLDLPAIVPMNAPDNVAHTPTTVGNAPHDGGDTTPSPPASYSPSISTKPDETEVTQALPIVQPSNGTTQVIQPSLIEKPEERERTKKPTKAQLITAWYTAINGWYRKREDYPDTFKVPRNKGNDKAISGLIDAGATLEQAEFVFDDICEDPDPFWLKHRNITSVNSQFVTRIPKMKAKESNPARVDRAHAKNTGRVVQNYSDVDRSEMSPHEWRQTKTFYREYLPEHPEDIEDFRTLHPDIIAELEQEGCLKRGA